MKIAPLCLSLAALFGLAACSASTSTPTPAPPAHSPAPKAAAAAAPCKLKTTFNYIERVVWPPQPATAQEIGNIDLGNCTPTLQDFTETAGTAQGECTSIALASANPGYNVNASPAPRLHRVLMRAGPGC